jgi:hypothetical protein
LWKNLIIKPSILRTFALASPLLWQANFIPPFLVRPFTQKVVEPALVFNQLKERLLWGTHATSATHSNSSAWQGA